MDPTWLLWTLLNWVAPAAALAALLCIHAVVFGYIGPVASAKWALFAILFVVGVGAIAIGLWLTGQDGRLLTYAALAISMATTQAFWQAWQRRRGRSV